MTRHLDLSVLRSFVLIADGRSFAEVADLVGRSASAITLQMQRLEVEIGAPVFLRTPRSIELTLAGERLLGHARQLLALNDATLSGFRSAASRPLRFGATQDFADGVLPEALSRFGLEHPGVDLAMRIDRSQALIDAVHKGELDVAISIARDDTANRGVLAQAQMIWIGREGLPLTSEDVLPLALFDPPCTFRSAALEALSSAGRSAKVIFTSPSLAGLRGAAEAGIGLTVRTRHLLRPGLVDVGAALGLPPLPQVQFATYIPADEDWPARDDLVEFCRRAFDQGSGR